VAGMCARIRMPSASEDIERIPVAAARGRVVAEAIAADRDSPPFDASSMDGYAARAAEIEAGMTLRVCGESRIGTPPLPMPQGQGVVRIATGAGVPHGADCVIRREDVVEHGSR